MKLMLLTMLLWTTTPESVEVERVQAHLLAAERAARAAPTDHLTPSQRKRRRAALDVLRHYRARGRFPRNTDFAPAMPYFVDDRGVRCAMAELIHSTGDDDLVEAVARSRNNAFVPELADNLRLAGWLEENGLSLAEAAAIQPSYCAVRSASFCGRAGLPGLPRPSTSATATAWCDIE